jgi:WD40 repeat protein/serine/threonine protein kinase
MEADKTDTASGLYVPLPRPQPAGSAPYIVLQRKVQQAACSVIGPTLPWQLESQAAPVVYTTIAKASASHTPPTAFITIGRLRLNKIDPTKLILQQPLGKGQFGVVSLAKWEGAAVAVKEVAAPAPQERQAFEREVQQLAQLYHPRVVCFYGISIVGDKTRMVMEYCPKGTLRALLDRQVLDWTQKTALGCDIASALAYLHHQGVLHLDLAADNVLLDLQGRPKLGDFGLSLHRVAGKLDMKGHPHQIRKAWHDPEVVKQGAAALSEAADLYSFGVVLWELATGRTPTDEDKAKRLASLPQGTPLQFRKVIESAWGPRKSRPTAAAAGDALALTQGPAKGQARTTEQLSALLRSHSRKVGLAWQHRFSENLPYIPPEATPDLQSSDRISAQKAITTFLEGKAKVLLILGDSGMGKSSLLAKVALSEPTRIPVLASLASVPRPEHNLMETLLQQQGLNGTEIESLKKEPMLLVLDGYDEIATEENLYIKNQLQNWNVKVIISCRTQRISRMQGDYKTRFSPPHPREFEQLALAPFTPEQIEEYLIQHCRSKELKPELNKLKAIPGLSELLSNPFSLFLVVSVFPQLAAAKKTITRCEIYGAFLKQWYDQQWQRLISLKLVEEDADIPFEDHATGLAVALFQERTLTAHYCPDPKTVFGTEASQVWAPYLDDRYHPYVPLLCEASPIAAHGNEWSFLHKSIWEYYVAQAILSQLEGSPDLLNHHLLNDEEGIIDFVAEAISREPVSQDSLFAIVERSRDDPTVETAAANAMTLLARAKVSFSLRDLHGVHIGGAILSGALLHRTNLKGADLSGCTLINTWLDFSDLSEANLTGVNLGQRPFIAHDSGVHEVCFSQDGQRVATHTSLEVVLWDASTGERLFCIEVKNLPICQIALSPDGKLLALGARDGTARLWESHAYGEYRLPVHEGRTDNLKGAVVAFSPTGKYLATGGDDHLIRMWDRETQQELFTLKGHAGRLSGVAFTPGGKYLISASEDGTVRVWELQFKRTKISRLLGKDSGKERVELRKQCALTVYTLAVSADGKYVAGLDYSGAQVWKFPSMQHVCSVKCRFGAIALSRDGRYLAVSAEDDAQLWAVPSAQLITSFRHAQAVTAVAFPPDGTTLAAACRDGKVRIWELPLKASCAPSSLAYGRIDQLAVSPNDRWLAFICREGICVWDCTVGALINKRERKSYIRTLALSAGEQLATGDHDGKVEVWNFASGKLLHSFEHGKVDIERGQPTDYGVLAVAFHSEGNRLATGGSYKLIRVWDLARDGEDYSLTGHTETIKSLAFSPDGSYLAGADGFFTCRLWHCQSRETIGTYDGLRMAGLNRRIAFSPDSKYFAFEDTTNIQVLRCDSRESSPICIEPESTYGFWDIAFSSDGKYLRSVAGTVNLFNYLSGETVLAMVGEHYEGALISGKGQLVDLNYARDRVRIWRADPGQQQLALVRICGEVLFTAVHTKLRGVQGISPTNLRVLKQHGAVD